MKAAQLVAPGRFEVREVADPEPAAGEVLVLVGAAGICGSDAHIVHAKEALFALPLTLGHETAGFVEKLGPWVNGPQRGQAVLVAGIWGSGLCRACIAVGLGIGSFQLVADAPPSGKPKWGVTLIRPYGATKRDLFEVIGLMQNGKLKADLERHPLAEAPAVLTSLMQGRVRGRAVLVP